MAFTNRQGGVNTVPQEEGFVAPVQIGRPSVIRAGVRVHKGILYRTLLTDADLAMRPGNVTVAISIPSATSSTDLQDSQGLQVTVVPAWILEEAPPMMHKFEVLPHHRAQSPWTDF